MPYSLQEITDAWGRWSAAQYGTACRFTASTKYSDQSDLDGYHQHEVTTKTLDTEFGENRGGRIHTFGGHASYSNGTEITQPPATFSYSETKAKSFTWGLTDTIKIGVSAKASVGVPEVGGLEVSLSTELDLTSSQSLTVSDSSTWNDTIPVVVPPHSTIKCQTVIETQKYDVPFTSRVQLTGAVAIWYYDKVDGHWLWFVSISRVISQCIEHNIISTDGYEAQEAYSVIAEAQGTLTGDLGVNIDATLSQYPYEDGRDRRRGERYGGERHPGHFGERNAGDVPQGVFAGYETVAA